MSVIANGGGRNGLRKFTKPLFYKPQPRLGLHDRAGAATPLFSADACAGRWLPAAVHTAIGAAPAMPDVTVVAASIRSAPATRAASLCDLGYGCPAFQRCHNHCSLRRTGKQQHCRCNKAADAEIGHVPTPYVLMIAPRSNRTCERAIRCLVPTLTGYQRSSRFAITVNTNRNPMSRLQKKSPGTMPEATH